MRRLPRLGSATLRRHRKNVDSVSTLGVDWRLAESSDDDSSESLPLDRASPARCVSTNRENSKAKERFSLY